MPKPPIIASTAGQRLAISLLMGGLLAGSLAVAAGYTSWKRPTTAHQVGAYAFHLGERWTAGDPGPWGTLLSGAQLFEDRQRPTRLLVVGARSFESPTDPAAVVRAMLEHVLAGPYEVVAEAAHDDGVTHRVELCVTGMEGGRPVQHLLASVTASGDSRRHVVFYMRDVVTSQGAFLENMSAFRQIHLSMQAP